VKKLLAKLWHEWKQKSKQEKLLIIAECSSGFLAGFLSAVLMIVIRKLLGGCLEAAWRLTRDA